MKTLVIILSLCLATVIPSLADDPAIKNYQGAYKGEEGHALWLQHKESGQFEGYLMNPQGGEMYEVDGSVGISSFTGTFTTSAGKKFPLTLSKKGAGGYEINLGPNVTHLLIRQSPPDYVRSVWECEGVIVQFTKDGSGYLGKFQQGANTYTIRVKAKRGILQGVMDVGGKERTISILPQGAEQIRFEGNGDSILFNDRAKANADKIYVYNGQFKSDRFNRDIRIIIEYLAPSGKWVKTGWQVIPPQSGKYLKNGEDFIRTKNSVFYIGGLTLGELNEPLIGKDDAAHTLEVDGKTIRMEMVRTKRKEGVWQIKYSNSFLGLVDYENGKVDWGKTYR